MHWRRILGITLTVVLSTALLIYGFRPAPQQVDIAQVKRGPLSITIDEEGKSRVIDRYVISSPITGYAHRIQLDVGDQIKQGQALLTLEPLPSTALDPRSYANATARVEAAKATLASMQQQANAAEDEAELAQRDYERIVDLCKVACAKSEEDQALTRARSTKALQQSAQFAVDVARYELKAAQTALTYAGARKSYEKLAITSPINGSVLKIVRKSEGVANTAEPLIEVGDTQRLEIEVDVLSADAVKITPGTRVLFERWGGDKPLEGRVRTIEPEGFTKISALGVEEQRVWVISDITSPPEEWRRLGDGYRVEASFVLWEAQNVLTIPASSLFRYDDGWAVFVVEDETAKRVKVAIGQRNGLSAQVLSGLNESQRVITHPGETINDGVKVRIR